MIDPSLKDKAEQAARFAAARAKKEDPAEWLERLYTVTHSPKLKERIVQVQHQYWAGALPTWEPAGLAIQCSSSPLPVIGIDGSQIYPPERSPVLWAYIQAVAYRIGCPLSAAGRRFPAQLVRRSHVYRKARR